MMCHKAVDYRFLKYEISFRQLNRKHYSNITTIVVNFRREICINET